MDYIGEYNGRKVYWLDYAKFETEQLPNKDWICLAFANTDPNTYFFEKFAQSCIKNSVLEFKGQGAFAEKLHNLFDETIVVRQVIQKHRDITAHTTWHTEQPAADVFWECFHATRLPTAVDLNDIKIICVDMDGLNRREELKGYLAKFSEGWSPGATKKINSR